jgi:hypothetical protein
MKKPILFIIIIFSMLSCEKTESGLVVETIEVFNGDSPESWTDLDLSNAVGENYAYVTLKVTNQSAITEEGVILYFFKQKGDATYYFTDTDDSHIIGARSLAASQVSIYTDHQGQLEWKAEYSVPTSVEVIAYIK